MILKNDKGYSAIEWVVVLMLLMVFITSTFVLAASASQTYENLVDDHELDTELRIAASYLSTKLKQNDEENVLHIVSRLDQDGNALLILETILDETYETWIYLSDGFLREATIPMNAKLDDDLSFPIAKIDYFSIDVVDEKSVFIEIGKGDAPLRQIFFAPRTLR